MKRFWPYLTLEQGLSRDNRNENQCSTGGNQNQSSGSVESITLTLRRDKCCNVPNWSAFCDLISTCASLTNIPPDVGDTCTLSSVPSGKECREQFLFIRLPAIWNQISPEDTMKLQIFSLPVHLPAKAHWINITTLSFSSCYKLACWWHFDQACVSPQSRTCTYTQALAQIHCVQSLSLLCLPLALLPVTGLAGQWSIGAAACLSRLSALCSTFVCCLRPVWLINIAASRQCQPLTLR